MLSGGAIVPALAVARVDPLVCALAEPAFDADGDPVTTTIAWTVDGLGGCSNVGFGGGGGGAVVDGGVGGWGSVASGGFGGGGAGTWTNYAGGGGGSFLVAGATEVATSDGAYDDAATFGGAPIAELAAWQEGDGEVVIHLVAE